MIDVCIYVVDRKMQGCSIKCMTLWDKIILILGPEDAESFQFEVRSFLSELNCPHTVLLKDMSSLDQPVNRLILIGQLFLLISYMCFID